MEKGVFLAWLHKKRTLNVFQINAISALEKACFREAFGIAPSCLLDYNLAENVFKGAIKFVLIVYPDLVLACLFPTFSLWSSKAMILAGEHQFQQLQKWTLVKNSGPRRDSSPCLSERPNPLINWATKPKTVGSEANPWWG